MIFLPIKENTYKIKLLQFKLLKIHNNQLININKKLINFINLIMIPNL